MRTLISNEIIIQNPTESIRKWADNFLVLDNPEYKQLKVMGKDDYIRWKRIPEKLKMYSQVYNEMRLPFGCLHSLWKTIRLSNYTTAFNNAGDISIKDDIPNVEFFDYQEKAISAMVKAKGGVLCCPCGGGKTYMGIEIIKRIGKKALWLCHTGDLLRQAEKDCKFIYPNAKIGLTTEGELNIGEDITISTVQTMVNIDPQLYKDKFDVVICDECAHVASSPTQMRMFGKVLSNIPARVKIGLTATPARSDGLIRSMYAYIGTNLDGNFLPTYKVDRKEVNTMVAEHIPVELNNGYEFRLYEFCDTSGMIVYNKLIAALSDDLGRTRQIVDNVAKCALQGRKQVVLTLRVEHCKQIVQMLNSKGVKAVLCTGSVKAKDRKAILNQEVQWDVLVATYSLLKEGVSIKELDTLHLATPVKDKSMVVQSVGRIERFLPDKKQPIVYDYVDMDIPYCTKAYNARKRALKTRF